MNRQHVLNKNLEGDYAYILCLLVMAHMALSRETNDYLLSWSTDSLLPY